MIRTTTLILALSIVALPWSSRGTSFGRLRGDVLDSSGVALPGVKVTATHERGTMKETQTKASGEYVFENLQPGEYTLKFALDGFAGVVHEQIQINAGF